LVVSQSKVIELVLKVVGAMKMWSLCQAAKSLLAAMPPGQINANAAGTFEPLLFTAVIRFSPPHLSNCPSQTTWSGELEAGFDLQTFTLCFCHHLPIISGDLTSRHLLINSVFVQNELPWEHRQLYR
jgi:hypothetical protein